MAQCGRCGMIASDCLCPVARDNRPARRQNLIVTRGLLGCATPAPPPPQDRIYDVIRALDSISKTHPYHYYRAVPSHITASDLGGVLAIPHYHEHFFQDAFSTIHVGAESVSYVHRAATVITIPTINDSITHVDAVADIHPTRYAFDVPSNINHSDSLKRDFGKRVSDSASASQPATIPHVLTVKPFEYVRKQEASTGTVSQMGPTITVDVGDLVVLYGITPSGTGYLSGVSLNGVSLTQISPRVGASNRGWLSTFYTIATTAGTFEFTKTWNSAPTAIIVIAETYSNMSAVPVSTRMYAVGTSGIPLSGQLASPAPPSLMLCLVNRMTTDVFPYGLTYGIPGMSVFGTNMQVHTSYETMSSAAIRTAEQYGYGTDTWIAQVVFLK
jgi:hypothetical protein